jgi:hypothetical protein
MTFTIKFRPTQGTLLRILSEITRRALELDYVHAFGGIAHLRVDKITDKQKQQLLRAWRSTIDVEEASFS